MTRAEFQALYAECLAEAIKANPDHYFYPAEKAPIVAAKMCKTMAKKGTGHVTITSSEGFRRLAKRLGIKHTHQAVAAAWNAYTKE